MSIFNDVLVKKPGRSLFNLTHERKFSCDWAYLYPILCMELVPGDTVKVSTEVFLRTAPLVAPIMHRVDLKMYYFQIPDRIIYDEFEDFITGIDQRETYDPTNTSANHYFVSKVPPYARLINNTYKAEFTDGSLADFLGFPTIRPNENLAATFQSPVSVQLLPFRAYQKVYNDWFRNQNVEAPAYLETKGGLQSDGLSELFKLRRKMWEKDYFTSALPFAQRGDAVQIPIAEVTFNPQGTTKIVNPGTGTQFNPNSGLTGLNAQDDRNGTTQVEANNNSGAQQAVNIDNSSNLKVTAGTINDLRLATRLQRWLEINSRVGGRYIEQILGHFGIRSSDARLQRTEYLGGWSQPIVVEGVDQTSASLGDAQFGDDTPQGNQAGKGVAYKQGRAIKCFAEEHGFLLGIMCIIPRTSYQDGLPKMFQRNYKEDYYFPEFANLGEQEVNRAELKFNLARNDQRSFDRFGFQERYCEYKYIPSTVHGEFKNNLQFWHLGRSFNAQPVLNKSFVECDPRTNVFAVMEDVSHFYVNLVNHVTALRPMPKQAIPTL